MASNKEYLEFILEQLSDLEEISYRAMMGEYIIYYRGKVAYGFTTMIAIGECPYTDEQISAIFTEFSLSICKAYKEIPGLTCGKFDKDAIFEELVKKGKDNNGIKD